MIYMEGDFELCELVGKAALFSILITMAGHVAFDLMKQAWRRYRLNKNAAAMAEHLRHYRSQWVLAEEKQNDE